MIEAYRIGLLGPYGKGNLGDAAIQESLIHHIRKLLPQAQCVGISLDPRDTASRHRIESFPLHLDSEPISRPAWLLSAKKHGTRTFIGRAALSLFARLHILATKALRFRREWRFIRSLGLLLIAGGGQIDDYWGGPWRHPFALMRWCVLARLARKQVCFIGVGASRLRSPLSRALIKLALGTASFRSVRDTRSRAYLESLSIKHVDLTPDPAFGYPLKRIDRATDKPRLTIGIQPISAAAWTTRDDPSYRAYLQQLGELARQIIDWGHTVLLVSSHVGMDRSTIQELHATLVEDLNEEARDRIIIRMATSVDEFLDALMTCDLTIASRLHGVLLSMVAHRPTMAIAYDTKVQALMEDSELEQYCVDLNTTTLAEWKATLLALMTHREATISTLRSLVARSCATITLHLEHVLRLSKFMGQQGTTTRVGHSPETIASCASEQRYG